MNREFPEKDITMDLHGFRNEIAGLKMNEKGSVHFRDLDPHNLTEDDMAAYILYKKGEMGIEDFRIYEYKAKNSGNEDSFHFAAFLANKLTTLFMDKDYDKRKTG